MTELDLSFETYEEGFIHATVPYLEQYQGTEDVVAIGQGIWRVY